MNKFKFMLFLTLSYLSSASGFSNMLVNTLQCRNAAHTSLRMCNLNASSVMESLQNMTSRRRLLQLSTTPLLYPLLPYIANAQNAEDDTWTRHSGPFSENELGDFTKTSSGLLYKDIQLGKGPQPNDGDAVRIEMVGYIFESGEKWCNTYKGIPAYQSVVRAGARENQKFMKGLNEGVKSMSAGGKRILVIPAYLAYNYVVIYSQENPSVVIIPGGAALVCYVEMLDFKPLV